MLPLRLAPALTALAALALGLAGAPAAAQQQQTGRIVGRVVDAAQGAPIAGAQLDVLGTTINAVSALDGRFTLPGVPAGPQAVRVRMIGYGPKTVTGVVVPAGGAVAQDISLAAEAVQLQEIEVAAEAERGSVNRALEEQRHSTAIVNAISAEQIARSPDGDAGQAVQRVSGVTVQDGKYVFVRGLGERYTTTSLNGSRIPSPDPEKKVVPLDLFPSGLLEGITTSKTFTPDQSGDFSGASVNLKTREFPARRTLTFSASAGANLSSTGKDIIAAPTEGGEWIGNAGTARQLPASVAAAGDLQGLSQSQIIPLIASFRDVWSASSQSGSPNGGFSASLGGEDPVFGQPIGYLGSFTYSNGQEIKKEEYNSLIGGDATTAVPYNPASGSTAMRSVLWGGLLNLSTRIGSTSRLAFNNSFTRGADNEATQLLQGNEEFARDLFVTRLTFTTRQVRSNQLQGEHLVGQRHLVDWSVANSNVKRDEPDRSDLAYNVDATGRPTSWFNAPRAATRTFAALDEDAWDLGGNYRLILGDGDRPLSIKVGGAYRAVQRDAASRPYDILPFNNPTEQQLTAAPEVLFGDASVQSGIFTLHASPFGGVYRADDRVAAGYAMTEISLGSRLSFVGGARVERWNLDLDAFDPVGVATPVTRRNTDVLPSAALTYRLTDDQNLRASVSQTLSRPEYRELAPIDYFGSFGTIRTRGNPDLERALVQNYDLRWEWFPRGGEVLSVGVFAKRFEKPIERVYLLIGGARYNTYINARSADNYGVEGEVRKSLDFLSPALVDFSFFSNLMVMSSSIEPGSDVLTSQDRPMYGQASFSFNGGVNWGTESGWNAAMLYNVVGKRLVEAGGFPYPDTYELPRHLVDFSLQLPLAATTSVRFDAKNLLDAPVRWRTEPGDLLRLRYKSGRVLSVGVSWQP